jgi:hypothetical protein
LFRMHQVLAFILACLGAGSFFVLRAVGDTGRLACIRRQWFGLLAIAVVWLPIALLNLLLTRHSQGRPIAIRLPAGYLWAPLSLFLFVIAFSAFA